jgi:AcrR family transcriptional regulator
VSTGQYDVDAARPRWGRLPRRERRAQLLSSALEVFVAQGYHAAAMDDIADRAGVSKPVLYQHFPGKLDLYLALLDASCDMMTASCRDALASTQDNKQRVAATMAAFYTYVAGDDGAFRLVFESDLTNEPAVRERVDRVTTDCAEMIAGVIHEDTGLPDEAARLLARAQFYLVKYHYRPEVARRYLLDVQRDYPETPAAPDAQALLKQHFPEE